MHGLSALLLSASYECTYSNNALPQVVRIFMLRSKVDRVEPVSSQLFVSILVIVSVLWTPHNLMILCL